MDAYLSRLMNDNVNPDILFDDEYYLFAGEGMYTLHPLEQHPPVGNITLIINIVCRLRC